MVIKEMQQQAFDNSEKHGFHTGEANTNIPSKMMLIVTEIVEALEEYRDAKPNVYLGEGGKPEGVVIELADAVIRIGDLVGMLKGDLQSAVEMKMAFNLGREHMHGKAF